MRIVKSEYIKKPAIVAKENNKTEETADLKNVHRKNIFQILEIELV
jgi:hypothetical protein